MSKRKDLFFEREVDGPKTHAFVIGVGSYPHAKAERGADPVLRKVPDLPSAADSAKLMCQWLIDNQDRLAAPLATLDVLISDPPPHPDRYTLIPGPVHPATEDNVRKRGRAWFDDVVAQKGNVAIFYCCGHGASHLQVPVLFLEDLNKNAENPWSHINLLQLAKALGSMPTVAAAFLFSDACGEHVADLDLSDPQECRFYPMSKKTLYATTGNNVSLICAAADGHLAYDGEETKGSKRRFGRFTQACLKGLSGSSARESDKGWAVNCRDLPGDLKDLRHIFFSHWGEAPFVPFRAVTPVDPLPIVYPSDFELPIVVMTDPLERMPHYGFVISQKSEPSPPWLRSRLAGEPGAWYTSLPPSYDGFYAIAVSDANNYRLLIQPIQPLFNRRVKVP